MAAVSRAVESEEELQTRFRAYRRDGYTIWRGLYSEAQVGASYSSVDVSSDRQFNWKVLGALVAPAA